MFAIIRTGGKQLKVSVDQKVGVEKIEAQIGDTVILDQVLMVGEGDKVAIGTPLLSSACVKAVVEDQTRTKKIIVFKKKRRQNYRRKNGHRQLQTVLRIVEIVNDGHSVKATKAKMDKDSSERSKETLAKKPSEEKQAPMKETTSKQAEAKKAPAKKESE